MLTVGMYRFLSALASTLYSTVTTHSPAHSMVSHRLKVWSTSGRKSKNPRQRIAALIAVTTACCAAAIYARSYMLNAPVPYHTSILSGRMWVQELLDGNPRRMRDQFGLNVHVFEKLAMILRQKGFLHDTRYVDVEEQLAMFLYTIGGNDCNRRVAERFQRSGWTISK